MADGEGENKVHDLPGKDGKKSATEGIMNQLKEASKKKKTEELKKAVDEALAARTVLSNAVQKVRQIEGEMADIDKEKVDITGMAKALGIE